ncbi:MAG: hypothetical protein IJZ55_08120 [Lachnospiraceae bacterium]|nr:hypothetical protein [Lachnospiraceae bacterium]
MYEDRVVLCVSNAYEKKYYLNEDFGALPKAIQDELKIMCVLFTEDVGGILSLVYEEDGTLVFDVNADEGDLLFDEIGSVLLVKKLQEDKKELLESLELYFKVFFLGEDAGKLFVPGY